MEYKLLEKEDLELMEEVLIDDGMVFDVEYLTRFIDDKNAYGLLLKKIIK